MIPRYAPTYTYSDLLKSLSKCQTDHLVSDLRFRLANLYKVKHVFLFSGARVALYALLRAFNRPGDVVMPAYNCIAVPEAALYAGYRPVFADIDYNSLNMTADTLKQSITSDTKVVLVTHQFGIPCDVDEILQVSRHHNVLVVEDVAAAIGARYRGQLLGVFGDASIISFHSTKVISGGMGGALLTNNDELARNIDFLLKSEGITRENGWRMFVRTLVWKTVTNSWVYPIVLSGYRTLRNERMFEVISPHSDIPSKFLSLSSSFSSILIKLQLDRLDWNLERRRKLAQIYTEELSEHSGVKFPIIPGECSPSWIQFPLMVTDKRAFYKHMQRNHIDLNWTFRYSCTDSFKLNGFPNAHKAAHTVLGLPTYPSLSDEQAQYVCNVIKEYLSDSQ